MKIFANQITLNCIWFQNINHDTHYHGNVPVLYVNCNAWLDTQIPNHDNTMWYIKSVIETDSLSLVDCGIAIGNICVKWNNGEICFWFRSKILYILYRMYENHPSNDEIFNHRILIITKLINNSIIIKYKNLNKTFLFPALH